MNCTICQNEVSSVLGMYNDCVIECLEKIKSHYISLKKQLGDKQTFISALKEHNASLNESIEHYERDEKKSRKILRTESAQSQSDLERSEFFETENANKSKDDLNRAVNDENAFEVSFVHNSPSMSDKIKTIVKREPMKSLPLSTKSTQNETVCLSKKIGHKGEYDSFGKKRTIAETLFSRNCENKDKPNKFLKSSYKSTPPEKQNIRKRPCSKNGVLRQTRLQLEVSRKKSNEDSTFWEETIEASPQRDSSLKKINSSRQWLLRNCSSKADKCNEDSTFNVSNASPEKRTVKYHQQTTDKALDTSSVVMLTPATQDIIFLDDSCESFNVESMDLLKGLMHPTENNLSNLRRIESNRIKLLQKTVSEKIENQHKNHPDFEAKQSYDSVEETEPKVTDLSNINLHDISLNAKDQSIKENDKKSYSKDVKNEDSDAGKKQKLFNVDCNECQTYIKYLGDRLSDREIEDHIRNCTKHKKRVELNLTPDGFWDPLIQPLDKNDPRNETQIDTRFIGKERRK